MKNNGQRVSKFKPFLDHYRWGEIDYQTSSNDFKKIEGNNLDIALILVCFGVEYKVFKNNDGKYANIQKPIKQRDLSKHNF